MRQSHLGVCSQGEFRFGLLSLARCDAVVSRAIIRVRRSKIPVWKAGSWPDEPCFVGEIVPIFDPSGNTGQFLSGV